MRNRTIPFGYQYQNGVLAVHPQESQTVRAVFAAYLEANPSAKSLPISPPSWWSTSQAIGSGTKPGSNACWTMPNIRVRMISHPL